MSLDVEIPDPPSLRGPQPHGAYEAIDMTDREIEDDYRREEIESFLEDGAWQDAFEEWAERTDLSAVDFDSIVERGMIEQFDFYWDPTTDDVGYQAPSVPDETRAVFEDDVDGIEMELDELGRVVSERLENDYLLRDEEGFGFFADEYTGEETPDVGGE